MLKPIGGRSEQSSKDVYRTNAFSSQKHDEKLGNHIVADRQPCRQYVLILVQAMHLLIV